MQRIPRRRGHLRPRADRNGRARRAPRRRLGDEHARSGTSRSGRSTKIGAVLVTVNTAYKIHEAEYLLRQSDTHTLDHDRRLPATPIMPGSSPSSAPKLRTPKPGEPLHCKRLPFLRNVITVGFRQKGCLTWEEALRRAEQVPVDEVYRMAAACRHRRRVQYAVHLRHHRLPQRRDAHALQRRQQRQMHRRPDGSFHRGPHDDPGADVPLLRHGAGDDRRHDARRHAAAAAVFFAQTGAGLHQQRAHHRVPRRARRCSSRMLEHPDFAKTDFSHMRTGIMAGSPCPIAVMKDVVEKMHMTEITIVYGQTESSPGCTMSSDRRPHRSARRHRRSRAAGDRMQNRRSRNRRRTAPTK